MAGLPVLAARRTSFSALLQELQQLWNEIGESVEEKDRMMLELERECMKVYQRKIEEARTSRSRLCQSLLAKEAEISSLMALLGEQVLQPKVEKKNTSLKGKLASVNHLLEYLRGKKEDRAKQFSDIWSQIEELNAELTGYRRQSELTEEHDLSLRKLAEYQIKLRSIQKEKSERIRKVLEQLNEVHCLCDVLGVDFRKTADEVHPLLHETTRTEKPISISDATLEGLSRSILKLTTEKKLRFQKLRDITASLFELWSALCSSREEMKRFEKVAAVIRSPVDDVVTPGLLSLETIKQAEAEVERLKELKLSRTKELVLKKRSELEEVCRSTHIEPPEEACELLDSRLVDHSELLADIEAQIVRAKEQSVRRKEIIDRVNKWLLACEEEHWLEDYNMDENKYTAGRGAHLNLKRAEKARLTIGRIPAIVDNLISKVSIWEDENNAPFLYDGVPLVSILEDHKLERLQKEEQKQRCREQKRLQNLLVTEKESIYGSRPTPKRSNSFGRKTSAHHLTNVADGKGIGGETPEQPPLSQRSSSARFSGYSREGRRLSSAAAAPLFAPEFGSPPL